MSGGTICFRLYVEVCGLVDRIFRGTEYYMTVTLDCIEQCQQIITL